QDRVIAGPAKPDRQVNEKERRVTAFHEAGHTVCGLVLNEARIVHKVTIVPRGKAGGYAIMLPREDQNMYNAKDLREQIVGLLGGRAAEEVFFNTQTSGASNDFEQATSLGRSMITEYGMSQSLGPISYEGNHSMRGAQSYGEKTYSAQTAAKIDQELLQLMEDCLAEAKQILSDHREQVTIIAEKLLELETLDARTIKSLFETGEMPAETVTEVEEEARPKTYDEVKEKMQREGQKKQEESKEQLEERQGLDASESDSEDQESGRRNEHIQEEIAQRRQDEKDED
ncbi:cell division protein FtsH, partial [Streptococcus anginosus]|nr:cell division protein FtsH [Streptococcus anginosus]